MMFLSIFAATCRPHNITAFLDNLAQTADDPQSFEVLIKLDEGANELIEIIESYKQTSLLNIKYLATTKLDGYYSLDIGYNELLKIAHPDTYFCWLLTDEIRLKTQGWDSILKNYIKFYPDDIFRIKLSIFQSKNYTDFFECLPCPDNYAVTTRKWLEITGGWGHFWGPDSWHQCIDFFLYLCRNQYNEFGTWRSFPIFDIKVGGQEAGQGIVDPVALEERCKRIWEGWQQHSTHAAQENFYKLAQRLNAHIYACARGLDQYYIKEDLREKTVSVWDSENRIPYQTWHYRIPKLSLRVFIGHKKGTFFQLFPWAMKYKGQIRLIQVVMKRIYNLFLTIFYNQSKTIVTDTANCLAKLLRFLSKCLENCLALPVWLARGVYHFFIKSIFPLPKIITTSIVKTLSLPLSLYQFFYKRLAALSKRLVNYVSNIKLFTTIKKYLPVKKRPRRKNMNLYLFDGKYLKEITDSSNT